MNYDNQFNVSHSCQKFEQNIHRQIVKIYNHHLQIPQKFFSLLMEAINQKKSYLYRAMALTAANKIFYEQFTKLDHDENFSLKILEIITLTDEIAQQFNQLFLNDKSLEVDAQYLLKTIQTDDKHKNFVATNFGAVIFDADYSHILFQRATVLLYPAENYIWRVLSKVKLTV